ncbi:MAG TPA: PepSY-like domain-containing protein [Balneolales bacterium]|nr:PepSY-like domain-containing protein [Balneolales bacterium]
MKKLILPILLLFTIGTYSVCYSQIKVPEKVSKAFNKKFPHAQKVKWGMENVHEYEADFVNKGQQMSANFKTNGIWVETEQDISASALPTTVRDAVNHDYKGAKIKGAARVQNPNGERYEIDAEVKEDNMELVYSTRGKLLSHSVIKDNDEGDGD